MESFLNRYRNITVLLLVIFAQLVLLAMQVKNDQDVRVIRVWAVTAVTPVARVVEWFRGGSIGLLRHYILLHDASEENRTLHEEVGRLRMENNFLRNELNTADRAKALQMFQAHTPSKMLAANIIGTGPGFNSKVVFVSRGSAEGVMRGMAVVTPDGIVGKVIAAYPTGSEVLLVTDPDFAAGVISQNSQVRGTLKGQGNNSPLCKVDFVPLEDKVEVGEWFYTSGDDRIFPRGLAVGVVKSVGPGQSFKDIQLEPSGLQHGLEDVLIILDAVHQSIPDAPPANQPIYISPAPPASQAPPTAADPANPDGQPAATGAGPAGTEADKLRSIYKSVGEAQKHTFGEGAPGTKPPDFTHLPTAPLVSGAPTPAPAGKSVSPGGESAVPGSAPAAAGTKTGGGGGAVSQPKAISPNGAPRPEGTKTGAPAGVSSQPMTASPNGAPRPEGTKTGGVGGAAAPAVGTKTGAPSPQTPGTKAAPRPEGTKTGAPAGTAAPPVGTKTGAPSPQAGTNAAPRPEGTKTGAPGGSAAPAVGTKAGAPSTTKKSEPAPGATPAPKKQNEPVTPPADKSGSPAKGPGGALR